MKKAITVPQEVLEGEFYWQHADGEQRGPSTWKEYKQAHASGETNAELLVYCADVADEWKAAIENAKWEKGDLARGFMENLLGERRDTSKDEPIPLPDFLKRPEDREKPPPPPERDPVTGKTIGEIAVEKAAALYDAGHKPMLMVGRKDPWLQPQPTPALNDVCASDGSYEFSHCRDCVVGPWAGSWAAVCRGGLYEAIPKACTHRVVVDPRSSRLILILVVLSISCFAVGLATSNREAWCRA